MSEWVDELAAFYTGPVIVAFLYIFVAAATHARKSRTKLGVITGIAILSMFVIARPLSPTTVYLGHVPQLQEGVGAAGIAVAGAVLFFRGREEEAQDGGANFVDYLLALGAFMLTVLVPVAGFLLLASMNPD